MVALPRVDVRRNGGNGSDDSSPTLTLAGGDGILDGLFLCLLHDIEILAYDNDK